MAEEKVAIRRPGHRFAKGHPHFPRKPQAKTLRSAQATAESLGFDVIALMLEVITTGQMPEPGGRKSPVGLSDRLRLLREVVQYLIVKPVTTVNATIDSRVATLDVTTLLMNPELAEAAQTLAIAMVEMESPITGNGAANYIAG
jgi:hypothetical protein